MENTNCYIFAFATFGHPNDFRQTPFKYANPEIAKQVKVFDLSNAIKVFPNSNIYSIRKESIMNSKLISYSIYSFAQEQASKRDGTFIGSSIILENAITDAQYVLNCLNEFHQKLTENNLINGILKVNHSKDFIPISNLTDFDKIKNPQIEINDLNFNINNHSLVVYCKTSPKNLTEFFNKSIDLLNIYDTIYFTDSEEVAKFVIQKGIFKFIQNEGEKKEFENEINNFNDQRKRIREQSISEFEKELQRINEYKTRTIQDFNNQIEQNKRIHIENERKLNESIEDVNKTRQFYDDFFNKTKSLINQIKHNNGKLDVVKQIHNSNKILFNDGISNLKKPDYTTTIAKPKPKGNLPVEQISQDFKNSVNHPNNDKKKVNLYKVATVILTILLLATWIYFMFFKSKPEIAINNDHEQVNSIPLEQHESPIEIVKLENLTPVPNSQLNENDILIVSNNIKYEASIDDVVKIIFSKNPTDIKNTYAGQEKLYSLHLLERNKHCFEERNGTYYFTKDKITDIPSFKK